MEKAQRPAEDVTFQRSGAEVSVRVAEVSTRAAVLPQKGALPPPQRKTAAYTYVAHISYITVCIR